MKFIKKDDDLVKLRIDVDDLSPLMLIVANAVINSETIHTHMMYWLSTNKYDAYRRMMDNMSINSLDILISRNHADKLLEQLTSAMDTPKDLKVARICVECHKGYIEKHTCEVK